MVGYFYFSLKDNNVEYFWPRTDMGNDGIYKQMQSEIEIFSGYGCHDTIFMVIYDDGKEIFAKKQGIAFRDQNHPW